MRRWYGLVLAALVVGVVGCGGEAPRSAVQRPTPHDDLGTHDSLAFLRGRYLTSRPLNLAPDRYWRVDGESGVWSFEGWAELGCFLGAESGEPLEWRLVPEGESARFHFRVRWDGEPLAGPPARPPRDGWTIEIPAELADPGFHRLRLERVKGADDPGDRGRKSNRFAEIELARGGRRTRLDSGDAERDRYLNAFLSLGLAGLTSERLSGCLFDGPGVARATLELGSPATMRFTVENASTRTAVFAVSLDRERHEVELDARERASLELPVAAGTHGLRLEVAGDPNGLFLWGAPLLAPGRVGLPGPIVVITLDTTRRDALSVYGAPAAATPELERLAGWATAYDNAYTTAPWTLPSHASIFTGLYPSHHGGGVWADRLPRAQTTLAELLAERGYVTAGLAGGHLCSARFGLGQGFLRYRDPDGFETRGDRLTDAALGLLDDYAGSPLFLFVNYFDPHALYNAPAEVEARFGVAEARARLEDQPYWREMAAGSADAWSAIISGEALVTDEALAYLQAAYAAEVAFMDAELGRLLDGLRERGLFDPALIVVAADHGELLGEGGFFSHGVRLDPELVEAPLIVKLPFQQAPGRSEDLVSLVDLLPTILSIVEIPSPPVDGLVLGRTSDRSAVLMEEHVSRVHPIPFENMLIAPHLFGIQGLDSREVVWEGGIRCVRRRGRRWEEAACHASWRERLDFLESLATVRLGAEGSVETGGLSREDEEKLRALGYLR